MSGEASIEAAPDPFLVIEPASDEQDHQSEEDDLSTRPQDRTADALILRQSRSPVTAEGLIEVSAEHRDRTHDRNSENGVDRHQKQYEQDPSRVWQHPAKWGGACDEHEEQTPGGNHVYVQGLMQEAYLETARRGRQYGGNAVSFLTSF